MKLTKIGDMYIALSTFQEKDIAKSAGFRFHSYKSCFYKHCDLCSQQFIGWWTKESDKAAHLSRYADNEELKNTLTKLLIKKNDTLIASRATNFNGNFSCPEGLAYLPFQQAGIVYAQDRDRVLIADQMGLGKTIEAIGIINNSPNIKKIFILCPATLKINWFRELSKWLIKDYSIGIAEGAYFPLDKDIIICNYDILKHHKNIIDSTNWDLFLADEVHYLRNTTAQRTVLTIGGKLGKGKNAVIFSPIKAKKVVFLTGSPVVNRPKELFPIIHYLDPTTWPDFFRFAKRYCNAFHNGWGWDFSGAANLEELQEKLRSTIMLRRLKEDVLKELPPKVRQVIELPSIGYSNLVDHELALWESHDDNIARLKAAVELSKVSSNPEDYRNAMKALQEGVRHSFTEMAKARHDTALGKIPLVIEHLKNILEEEDKKIVVFAHHHDVMDALLNAFPGIAGQCNSSGAARTRCKNCVWCGKLSLGSYGKNCLCSGFL